MQIIVTSDFQPSRDRDPADNLVGNLHAMFLDDEGNRWFAFTFPDVHGMYTIQAGSRFLVSVFGE